MRISERPAKAPRPKSHSKPQLMSRLGRFVEKITYADIFLFLTMFLLACAAILTSKMFGPLLFYKNANYSPDFLEALYFCLVTFTSLGYGDFAPIGFGRIVAIALVFVGVASLALVIAKLSSERTSTSINLLHRSDVERRLSEFSEELNGAIESCSEALDQTNFQELRKCFKVLRDIEQRSSQYLVFHSHQSTALVYGNAAALRFFTVQCMEAQRLCLAIHLEANKSGVANLDGATGTLVERLGLTVKFLLSLQYEAARQGSFVAMVYDFLVCPQREPAPFIRFLEAELLQAEKRVATLKAWRSANVTLELLALVEAEMPGGAKTDWPKGVHKAVANKLGISNSMASKCVTRLLAENRLPRI